MEDLGHYRHNCRGCPIRQRCIDDKHLSPSAKIAIARVFDSHTDTYETWDLLQQDCLLLREPQQQPLQHAESTLARRLRQVKQPLEEQTQPPAPPSEPEYSPPLTQFEPVETSISPIQPEPVEPIAPQISPEPVEPTIPWSPQPEPAATVKPPRKKHTSASLGKGERCGLAIAATQRMIRLPDEGVIILGRVEYGSKDLPDADLACDERGWQSVSRRHARVTGKTGQHWIEDIGSTNGTFLNGRRLPVGEKAPLARGDQITIGKCELAYIPLPKWALEPDARVPHISILIITHTGRQIRLPSKSEITLGRPDPTAGYIPDIDLSLAGDIAKHVSRRHARLTASRGLHFLEDTGSATGTRLNGYPICPGDAPMLLHPGDQLWLGGCVVAYEWKLG